MKGAIPMKQQNLRHSIGLLLLALIVPILAACGGAGQQAAAPTSAPAAAPTSAPAAEATAAPAADATAEPAAEATAEPADATAAPVTEPTGDSPLRINL